MSFGFDIAIGGLKVTNEALKVVSENIANADTEGYKRRDLVTSEMIPQKKDGFTYGAGVVVQEVKSAAAPYLFEKIINNNQMMSYNNDLQMKYNEIEKVIATEELGAKLQDFFNAMDNLKNNPTSEGNKALVVTEAQQMLDLFDYNKDMLNQIKQDAKTEIAQQIGEINQTVSKFKNSIASQNYQKTNNNFVEDEMDRLVETLSPYGEVDHYYKEDDTLVVRLNGVNVFDTYDNRELKYDQINNTISVGNNDMTTFFQNKGSIGAQLNIIEKGADKLLNEYDIIESSIIYEVNDLFHQSVVKELYSDMESTDILNVSKNRDLMGLTEEELPDLKNTPLFDIPTLKGLQPGNITITTYPEENEYIININHKTTLTSLKDSFENYKVTGLEKDFDEATQTLYGVEKGETLSLDFFDIKTENGLAIISDKPFSINDGDTNLLSKFGMNNFIVHSEGQDRFNVNQKYEDNPIKLFEYFDEAQTNGMEKNKLIINDIVDLNHKEIELDNEYLYNLSVTTLPSLNYTNTTITRMTSFSDGINDFNFKISLEVSKYTEQYENIKANNDFLNKEYDDVVGVNTDEELTELMRLQAAYQANTKVINAMNELFDSLLSI